MSDKMRTGFYAAAAYNIGGILIFTKGLTSQTVPQADPVMFSFMGCVMVMVWGLAYFAQSYSWRQAPAISAVFAVEKTVYAVWWGAWLWAHGNEIPSIFARDALAGTFFSIYGAGDAAFAVFFAWAAYRARR